jgi:D-3-phosphoglycerate dehydrogenase / 2-oxoglutarate reductase
MGGDLSGLRVVRLNAVLFPPTDFERAEWARAGLRPVEAEANTVEELIPIVAEADGVFAISVALPAPVVAAMNRCRVISRLGTGTDKIDVALAKARGILVTNVPTFCIEEQADHTMALLLALARKLPQMQRGMRAGAYNAAQGFSRGNRRVSGQTLGLVGFGNSARLTAQRARGFGMRVLATRRSEVPIDPALGVERVDLDTLLRESDHVSLHLPLEAATYHMMGAAEFARMKPGALFINTSRGALVDEAALEAALRSGHLGGAGLDTFERIDVFAENPPMPQWSLLELDNVIATPHVAASSVEAQQDVSRGGIENMQAVLRGHWPRPEHVVNAGLVPRTALAPWPGG